MNTCYVGDCFGILPNLPAGVVNCCVTSPPYWGLRDYGQDGQLGLESTPEEYVGRMVEVFREVRRLLRDDGTLWLNLGDSYASSGRSDRKESPGVGAKQEMKAPGRKLEWEAGGGHNFSWFIPSFGTRIKPKDLVGIPWRVAFALQADGWYLRQDIIWHKPNPMPESVTDRCTKAHEYVFLLSKSERYFYDHQAILEDAKWERWGDQTVIKEQQGTAKWIGNKSKAELQAIGNVHRKPAGWDTGPGGHGMIHRDGRAPVVEYTKIQSTKRNKRSVWTVTTQPYSDAHFATFPRALIEPMILAGCPPGGIVLDPFMGSGTVAEVAQNLGRRWIGCELNPDYVAMQKQRAAQMGLVLT